MNTLRPWLFFFILCFASVLAALLLRGGTNANLFATMESLVDEIGGWLSKEAEEIYSQIELPDIPLLTRVPQDSSHSQQVARSATSSPSADYTRQDSQACSRPPTAPRVSSDGPRIYKWVDENGQTHMSDQRPDVGNAALVNLGGEKKDFTYKIIPDGVTLPLGFQGQLAASSKRMYDTWDFFLGEENLRQSKIQLVLMGDPNRFDAYYAKASASSGNRQVAGFYNFAKNQAVVKYDAKRPAQNLRTTFHEVSHLITASHLGPTSPWLTEGLAEYFETMKVAGQGGVIYANQSHVQLLRKTTLPRLRDYLALDRSEWYGANRFRNYAIAWSVIHFLMSDAPGKYALQETVRQAHSNFCRPFSPAFALGKAYPGGILKLEKDWRRWLAYGDHRPLQT